MLDFLSDNLRKVRDNIENVCQKFSKDSKSITLCAVSKTKSIDYINTVFNLGVSVFGENYVQEIENKFPKSHSYSLHLIGHLQSNKIAKVLPFVDSIDSVDSFKLTEKLQSSLKKIDKKIDILLEYNSSGDASKTGFCDIEEISRTLDFISGSEFLNFKGLMTMGPLGRDDVKTRRAFEKFNSVFDKLESQYKNLDFSIKSFGMSSDYEIAIELGSNFLRIGRSIFGER